MSLLGTRGTWSPSGHVLFTWNDMIIHQGAISTINAWNVKSRQFITTLNLLEVSTDSILWALDDFTLVAQCSELQERSGAIEISLCGIDVLSSDSRLIRNLGVYFPGTDVPFLSNAVQNKKETLIASLYEPLYRGALKSIFTLNTNSGNVNHVGKGEVFEWKPLTSEITAIVGNGEIRTYDSESREIVASSHWFAAPVYDIALRPNTTQIASIGFGEDKFVEVWDIQRSTDDLYLRFSVEVAQMVDYPPDGRELIAGGSLMAGILSVRQLDAFDPDTGEFNRNLARFYDENSLPPTLYWNQEYTASSLFPYDLRLVIREFLAHSLLFTISSPTDVRIPAITAWNTDGSMFAVIREDRLEVFALQGKNVRLVSLKGYNIVDLEWATDDRYIVGGGSDGLIYVWGVDPNR